MIILPVAVVCVLAGWLGYRLGQVPSETELITHYAEQYVQDLGDGARLIDCVGRGGSGAVRIVLTCTHVAGDVTMYQIGPRGGLVDAPVAGRDEI